MIVSSEYVDTPLGRLRLNAEMPDDTAQNEIDSTEEYLNSCAKALAAEMNADPGKVTAIYFRMLKGEVVDVVKLRNNINHNASQSQD